MSQCGVQEEEGGEPLVVSVYVALGIAVSHSKGGSSEVDELLELIIDGLFLPAIGNCSQLMVGR